jgi:DNA-binding transcriptional MerR regulator
MTHPGAAQKSPEAYRTISEVSAELDVAQHVLRFWETKFAPVRPLKRGGGRRYYRPDDLDLLRGIRSLLYGDGMTIKGVQKILRERGPRHVMELGREEARTPVPPSREEAAPSNVHAFMRDRSKPDRTRLSALQDELLDLKARLQAARLRALRPG